MAKTRKKPVKRGGKTKTTRKQSSRRDDDRDERSTSRRNRDDYDNEKRGVLFRNKRKRKDSQPDMTGTVTVEGVEYWLSAWTNEARNGMKFLSLALQEKEELEDDERERSHKKRGRSRRDNDDDDLSF